MLALHTAPVSLEAKHSPAFQGQKAYLAAAINAGLIHARHWIFTELACLHGASEHAWESDQVAQDCRRAAAFIQAAHLPGLNTFHGDGNERLGIPRPETSAQLLECVLDNWVGSTREGCSYTARRASTPGKHARCVRRCGAGDVSRRRTCAEFTAALYAELGDTAFMPARRARIALQRSASTSASM